MPHMHGKKISGRHTTVIQAAVSLVQVAVTLPEVSKIVLGVIKPIRGTAVIQRLKVTNVEAGLRLKVRGPSSVQELYIYTDKPKLVETVLAQLFS